MEVPQVDKPLTANPPMEMDLVLMKRWFFSFLCSTTLLFFSIIIFFFIEFEDADE